MAFYEVYFADHDSGQPFTVSVEAPNASAALRDVTLQVDCDWNSYLGFERIAESLNDYLQTVAAEFNRTV